MASVRHLFPTSAVSIAALLLTSGCATGISMTREDSEGLLTYVDFSRVSATITSDPNSPFESEKRECAVQASSADTSNMGEQAAGIALGSLISAAVMPTTIPILLLSGALTWGAGSASNQSNAPAAKTNLLVNCLKEKGYDVAIRTK